MLAKIFELFWFYRKTPSIQARGLIESRGYDFGQICQKYQSIESYFKGCESQITVTQVDIYATYHILVTLKSQISSVILAYGTTCGCSASPTEIVRLLKSSWGIRKM